MNPSEKAAEPTDELGTAIDSLMDGGNDVLPDTNQDQPQMGFALAGGSEGETGPEIEAELKKRAEDKPKSTETAAESVGPEATNGDHAGPIDVGSFM